MSYDLDFPTCEQLTCGYYRTGQRFGDPHAVYFNPNVAPGRLNLMQAAAFLAIESTNNPLCEVLEKEEIIPSPLSFDL